jgi:hypothetical protein
MQHRIYRTAQQPIKRNFCEAKPGKVAQKDLTF